MWWEPGTHSPGYTWSYVEILLLSFGVWWRITISVHSHPVDLEPFQWTVQCDGLPVTACRRVWALPPQQAHLGGCYWCRPPSPGARRTHWSQSPPGPTPYSDSPAADGAEGMNSQCSRTLCELWGISEPGVNRINRCVYLVQLHRVRGHDILDFLLHLPHGEGFASTVTGKRVATVALVILRPVAATFLEAGLSAQLATCRRRVMVQTQRTARHYGGL